MSDLDDLILREHDEVQCYSCNDGRTLADGWKCDVCGRLNSKDADYLMNEQQNTQPVDPTMTKSELAKLQDEFRRFIDFVDFRDSQTVAKARTNDWASRLMYQHEENSKVLNSALNHIIAVKNSPQ